MAKTIFERLLHRPTDSHKYQYGHVLVIGGSPGMIGAPLLSAEAALRTGAGLVTIAATPDVADKLERRVEAVMTLRLPDESGEAAAAVKDFIAQRKVSAMVFGPGLTPDTQTTDLLSQLLHDIELPIVVDGGGLGALAGHLELLANTRDIILTPHTGEFQRLVSKKLPETRSELKPLARRFAEEHRVTLVLKGQPTYVAHPDGSLYENTTGNPGLATAGTGDVLSGVIAGMIAQHIEPAQAAEAAVYLHGLAGDIAAKAKTQPGMTATDVIEAIPEAFRRA